jgi:hypothetical protein
MAETATNVTARYVYRVEADVARGRSRVRCYLVERLGGTNVVARVEFLGALAAPRRDTSPRVALGRWHPSPSARYSRALVTVPRGA